MRIFNYFKNKTVLQRFKTKVCRPIHLSKTVFRVSITGQQTILQQVNN